MYQIEQMDIELIQRLYISALSLVQEAEESPKDVSIPSDHFRELELATNFLRERMIFEPFVKGE